MSKDYYEVLGVARNTDRATIKRAYQRLAQELHPDRNNGQTTEEFQELVEAYTVLVDPEKRERYDAGEVVSGVPPTLREQARGVIRQAFVSLVLGSSGVAAVRQSDFIETLRTMMMNTRKEVSTAIMVELINCRKFREASCRARGKGGDRLLQEVAREQRILRLRTVQSLRAERRLMEEILDVLDGFEYEVEIPASGDNLKYSGLYGLWKC